VSAGDDDYEDAMMMGSYDFAGAPPLMPQAYAPMMMSQSQRMQAQAQAQAQAPMPMMMPQRRVMHVSNYMPPPGYKLVPLGVDDGSTGMSTGKKVMIVLAVIVVIGAIVYYIKQNKGRGAKAEITPTQAMKKLPTSRLAQNLYARLAKNGKASRGVLSALGQIAQE
jgi:hypothetical protein